MESNPWNGNSEIPEDAGWHRPDIILAEVVPEGESPPWPGPRRHGRRVWLPAVLFVATCLSTFAAGTYFSGDWTQGPAAALLDGLKYSMAVMTILLCHEMGHFIQAWRYGVYASLPYFIPMPISPIGTFGAVIAMEPRMGDRRAIFDIGISGPLAGLVPTIFFCILGLHWSTPTAVQPAPGDFELGMSPLFAALSYWFVPLGAGNFNFHPVAVAGWVGLLITALNLVPVGQFDGGHILYAMLRTKAHWIARFVMIAAVAAVIAYGLFGWMVMLFLMMMLGTRHPPTADDNVPLGWVRYVLGWLTLTLVPLGFIPVPISVR